jgi:hypothetical protein
MNWAFDGYKTADKLLQDIASRLSHALSIVKKQVLQLYSYALASVPSSAPLSNSKTVLLSVRILIAFQREP